MPTAEVVDGKIVLQSHWAERDLVKLIPGARWNGVTKLWELPLTWPSCLQLRGIFGDDLNVEPNLVSWSWNERQTRVDPVTHARTSIAHVDGYHPKLYPFQTAGAEFMKLADDGSLLGDDLGMGKTAQALATLSAFMNESVDSALPALVICPNSVKAGWVNQIEKWNIPVNPYMVVGTAAARRKILQEASRDPRAFVIINIEAVRQFSRLAAYGSQRLTRCRECDPKHGEEGVTAAKCEVHAKELNAIDFRTVILDEAHRIKDPKSKQTRACWAMATAGSVKHRFALTGTPIANHVGDLWAILHFIAPHEHPTKSRFVDRYGLMSWNAFGGLTIVGVNPATKDEFYRLLDTRFRRTPKALVLEQLPKVVRATRWVQMSPKQASAYDGMRRAMIANADGDLPVVAATNLVKSTRLMQLASSYVKVTEVERRVRRVDDSLRIQHGLSDVPCTCVDPTSTFHDLECCTQPSIEVTLCEPSPKLDAMEEAYDDLGGKPVVIVAQSRQLIELAAKRFAARKISYGLITGGQDEYDRQLAIKQFCDNKINVILMTISAGGTGIDGLQHADTMFCLQRSWSMINNVQVDGRIDRIGSEKHESVTIIDFVTEDTIEQTHLYPRLQEKMLRLEEIIRDRKRLMDAGVPVSELFTLDNEEAEIMSSNLGLDVAFDDSEDDNDVFTLGVDATDVIA